MNSTTQARTIERTVTIEGTTYTVQASRNPFDAKRDPPQRIYRAWVPTTFLGNHGTMSSLGKDSGHFGLVGTERDRERYEHMRPASSERIAMIDACRALRAKEAQRAIRAAFPEICGREEQREFLGEYEIASSVEVA